MPEKQTVPENRTLSKYKQIVLLYAVMIFQLFVEGAA